MARSREEILADIQKRIGELKFQPITVDTADTQPYQTGSTLAPNLVAKKQQAQLRQGKPPIRETQVLRQGVDAGDKALSFGAGVAKGFAFLPEPTEEEKDVAESGLLRAGSTNPALSLVHELYIKGRTVESGWGTAGEIAGAAIPLSKAFKAVGVVKVGAEKVLAVVLPKAAAELGGKMARGAVVGAGYGTAKEGVEAALTDEPFDVGEVGKESAMFAGGEGALSVLGKVLKPVKEFFTRTKHKLKSEAGQEFVRGLREEQEIAANLRGEFPDIVGLKEVLKLSKADRQRLVNELREVKNTDEMSVLGRKVRAGLDLLHASMKGVGVRIGKRDAYFPQVPKFRKQIWKDVQPIINKLQQLRYEVNNQTAFRGGEEELAGEIANLSFSPETNRLIGYLSRTKQWSNSTDDILKLGQMGNSSAMDVIMPTTRFAKLRPFDLSLPDPAKLESLETLAENDIIEVLEMYGKSAAETIARRKTWGEAHERYWQTLMGAPANESDIIRTMMDAQTGVRVVREGFKSPIAQDVFDAYMNFGSATKIGGGTSALPNLVQFLGVAQSRAGTINTLIGAAKAFAKDVREKVRRSGSLGVYDPFSIATETSGEAAFAKTSHVATTPFRLANESQAMLVGSIARETIQEWYSLANRAGNGFRSLNARHQLRTLGINYKSELTEELLQQKIYRFTADTQLYRDITNEPLWMSNPKLAPLLFLKKYGMKQAYAIKDMLMIDSIIRDAAGKVVAINPLPAARMAAGGLAGGEFVRWGKDKIEQLTTGNVSMSEGDIDIVNRINEDFAAMGAFGIISDVLRPLSEGGFLEWGDKAGEDKVTAAEKAGWRLVKPVILSDIDRTVDALTSTIADIMKYNTETAIRRNAYKLPLGAIPSQTLRRIRPEKQKESEIKDARGKWVSGILDAIAHGDIEKERNMLHHWNDNHDPQYWIKMEDIDATEAGNRLRDRLWDKIEMENDGIKRPKRK